MNYINTLFNQNHFWDNITHFYLNRCFCKKRTTQHGSGHNPMHNVGNITKETQTNNSYAELLFQSNLFNTISNDDIDTEITTYDDINYHSVMPFIPQISNGKVITVYDGHSFSVASRLPYEKSPIYRFTIKLNGIISPEMNSKYETEKSIALLAKNALTELIFDKIVEMTIKGIDKYGRILAEVYLNNQNINYLMLLNGYAVQYEKQPNNSQDEWDIIN